jgi:hypothetical protein
MFRRIPQPPVNAALRAPERHEFYVGFIVALAGLILVIGGTRHLTSVDTVDNASASEIQLVKSFSSGGLQFPGHAAPPPPPDLEGVDNPGEALDRWAKQQARATPPTWKVRVDLGAKTPCPT